MHTHRRTNLLCVDRTKQELGQSDKNLNLFMQKVLSVFSISTDGNVLKVIYLKTTTSIVSQIMMME